MIHNERERKTRQMKRERQELDSFLGEKNVVFTVKLKYLQVNQNSELMKVILLVCYLCAHCVVQFSSFLHVYSKLPDSCKLKVKLIYSTDVPVGKT